jgi:hypothetical protein
MGGIFLQEGGGEITMNGGIIGGGCIAASCKYQNP